MKYFITYHLLDCRHTNSEYRRSLHHMQRNDVVPNTIHGRKVEVARTCNTQGYRAYSIHCFQISK